MIQNRTADIADGVRALTRVQRLVEEEGSPESLEPSGDNVRSCMLAIEEEVHELGRELNWRPWHASRPINREKALKEAGDVLAFVGLLMLYLMELTDVTPDEIAAAYEQVSISNMELLKSKRKLGA